MTDDERAELDRLRRYEAATAPVVKMARQLCAYDWAARLDDSATSDDAKEDARALEYALYEYDRAIDTATGGPDER